MILNGAAIYEWAKESVTPFCPQNINPASLDLTIGQKYIDLILDLDVTARENGRISVIPGHAILASTNEYIKMPNDCSGTLYLKSSLARIMGLDHALAGWIDPGFEGQLTLELHAHRAILLVPGQRICQLVLQRMEAPPERSYSITGRYNGQVGPTKAR